MTTLQIPQLLSITSAAAQLDCSRGHIYGLIAEGKLRAVEIKAKGTRAKTRIYASDLAAWIEENTRLAGPVPALRPVPRPGLHPQSVYAGDAFEWYSTTEAARRAQVRVDEVARALRDGQLHGTRTTPRGPWSIAHECLEAWRAGRACEHQEGDGAGEVRRIDGI